MANSFNISVALELSAIETKVDTVDTVVDAIRATDVPDIQTNINANETKIDTVDTVVDAIRATDVPGINTNIDANETKIDANKSVIDAIRATDVPNIQTNIDANETKIDTIDGIVDAIKIKTDAMPQNVRGTFYAINIFTTSASLVNALDITGHGKLYAVSFHNANAGDTSGFKIIADGVGGEEITHTGDTDSNYLMSAHRTTGNPNLHLRVVPEALVNPGLFICEFSTSLQVQYRRSAGTGGNIHICIYYSLDDF